jgi:hypothetical protein
MLVPTKRLIITMLFLKSKNPSLKAVIKCFLYTLTIALGCTWLQEGRAASPLEYKNPIECYVQTITLKHFVPKVLQVLHTVYPQEQVDQYAFLLLGVLGHPVYPGLAEKEQIGMFFFNPPTLSSTSISKNLDNSTVSDNEAQFNKDFEVEADSIDEESTSYDARPIIFVMKLEASSSMREAFKQFKIAFKEYNGWTFAAATQKDLTYITNYDELIKLTQAKIQKDIQGTFPITSECCKRLEQVGLLVAECMGNEASSKEKIDYLNAAAKAIAAEVTDMQSIIISSSLQQAPQQESDLAATGNLMKFPQDDRLLTEIVITPHPKTALSEFCSQKINTYSVDLEPFQPVNVGYTVNHMDPKASEVYLKHIASLVKLDDPKQQAQVAAFVEGLVNFYQQTAGACIALIKQPIAGSEDSLSGTEGCSISHIIEFKSIEEPKFSEVLEASFNAWIAPLQQALSTVCFEAFKEIEPGITVGHNHAFYSNYLNLQGIPVHYSVVELLMHDATESTEAASKIMLENYYALIGNHGIITQNVDAMESSIKALLKKDAESLISSEEIHTKREASFDSNIVLNASTFEKGNYDLRAIFDAIVLNTSLLPEHTLQKIRGYLYAKPLIPLETIGFIEQKAVHYQISLPLQTLVDLIRIFFALPTMKLEDPSMNSLDVDPSLTFGPASETDL